MRVHAVPVFVTGALGGVFLSLLIFWMAVAPVLNGDVIDGTDGRQEISFPWTSSRTGTFRIEANVLLRWPHPTVYHFIPDECIDAIVINGVPVEDPQLPFCDYSAGRSLPLAPYLHGGQNRLAITVRNEGGNGGLAIAVARSDTLRRACLGAALLILAGYSVFLLWWSRRRAALAVAIITAWGVLLRVLYTLATPWTVRAHDAGGHLEYVRYVAEHWSIPAAHQGFETYHPPLYYVLSAFLWKAGENIGLSVGRNIFLLQGFSLLLSIALLLIAVACGRALWPLGKKGACRSYIIFTALIATLPGLIFLSSRINNDILAQFSFFLFALLLLRWWRSPTWKKWLFLAILISASMLTKANGVLLVPIALLSLLFHRVLPWRMRFFHGTIFLVTVLSLTGWFFIPRILAERADPRAGLVGNVAILTNVVENTPATLLIFNPLEVLRHPFNDPFRDEERRAYLWEFFFRSAFFGEFDFGPSRKPLALGILLLAMFLFPVAVAGVVSSALHGKKTVFMPLSIIAGIFLFGVFLFRIFFPYSSIYDFRYATVIALPTIAGIAAVTHTKWHRYVHHAAYVSALSLAGLCAAFLISLSFS